MSFLFVNVYYGPCDTFDTCMHKPQLVMGIKDYLQKRGFRLNLIPVNYINYFMLEMCGHEIFRCNIKNLKFNTHVRRDKVSRRAIEAVFTSAAKFQRARTFLWFCTALDHQMFRRTKYGPKDFWPVDVDFSEFATCSECVKCCNILVSKKREDDDDLQKK